jgi:hypothetical protein
VPEVHEKLLRIAVASLAADAQGGFPISEQRIIATVEQYAPLAAPALEAEGRMAVVEELTKRFNVWAGQGGTLVGDSLGHEEWLSGKRARISWKFWVVDELNYATDEVLGYLEDPTRESSWRRQGLVMGHVQSGKTANYIGLICKAADAGYKVIVVLSGIHNSLRAQTQIRLDEGFLGYARPFGARDEVRRSVGVGLIDGTLLADSVTTREQSGDFSRAKARGFQIHVGGNVLLFVVKKNVKVLTNLIDWARLSANKPLTDGRMVVGDVALLVIDDEADQASVDTKVQAFDEFGQPDKTHDPRAINRLIRGLLQAFERRAYVGYTATPFANVFIHPEGCTDEGGEDLFPRHFIKNLSAPSDYFGPSQVFGPEVDQSDRLGAVPSRVRFVDDADEWTPPSHNRNLVPRFEGKERAPASLELAIRSFALASAARRARGQETQHKSMLVHVTRFTDVQDAVYRQVTQVVEDLKTRWRARNTSPSDPLCEQMKTHWATDFEPTSSARGTPVLSWSQVEPQVWPILEGVKVKVINAKATDALIYEEHKRTGLSVIAIGGDKLSRGLTLEGLTVSYFLRASRMYDTLMQMGRWFGYRPGYEDLCRLFLTSELAEWYAHITEAAEELRGEFDRMVIVGGTPDDYGLRVREHPVLSITGKLRPGLPEIRMSLSASPFEPTVFVERKTEVERNWSVAVTMFRAMGRPTSSDASLGAGARTTRRPPPGAVVWTGVSASMVRQLLCDFRFAEQQMRRTPSAVVLNYIDDRLQNGELGVWTVVAMGTATRSQKGVPEPLPIEMAGRTVYSLYRERHGAARDGLYVVRRVGSPGHEEIDLSADEYERLEQMRAKLPDDPQRSRESSGNRLVRECRPKERGLLILYLLTPDRGEGAPLRDCRVPLVAPYISFPYSPTAKAVSYRVSYRYWEQELGGVE